MKKITERIFAVIGLFLLGLSLAKAENSYPIVLIHGFTGWEKGQMGDYNYWGGRTQIDEKLKSAGYLAIPAAVSPMSSNWDRACELYAFLKGGTVDYGAAHSEKHGHERFGKTYPGILPEWGQFGDHRKIHIIAHSMGGQTARMLIHLLAEGDSEERARSRDDGDMSPLFEGGREWVFSLSTFSTPHLGTTIADGLREMPEPQQWMIDLALRQQTHARQISKDGKDINFDFKLEQWGLVREENESQEHYVRRVRTSPIWKKKDISLYDLSLKGAQEFNKKVKDALSVYYFSWAAQATKPLNGVGYRVLEKDGNPLFWLSSYGIGKHTPDGATEKDLWWDSDGVMNVISMKGPLPPNHQSILEVKDHITHQPVRGQWQFMGVAEGWDHFDMIGLASEKDSVEFYSDWAKYLYTLETTIPEYLPLAAQD